MLVGRTKLRFRFRQLLLTVLFTACQIVHAEPLPLRSYTVADGLPHNVINKIVRDSRGFLWFCTDDGLSRFDGYEFTNYGTNEGLPHAVVNDFLETRDGNYWVATNGGLCNMGRMRRLTYLHLPYSIAPSAGPQT